MSTCHMAYLMYPTLTTYQWMTFGMWTRLHVHTNSKYLPLEIYQHPIDWLGLRSSIFSAHPNFFLCYNNQNQCMSTIPIEVLVTPTICTCIRNRNIYDLKYISIYWLVEIAVNYFQRPTKSSNAITTIPSACPRYQKNLHAYESQYLRLEILHTFLYWSVPAI